MKYDTTAKALLGRSASRLLSLMLGRQVRITEILQTEFPVTENPRPDFVARLDDGSIIHVEIQAQWADLFDARMDRYWNRIYSAFRCYPFQVVLWLDEGPVTIPDGIPAPNHQFSYLIVDVKQIPAAMVLENLEPRDAVFAILCNTPDRRETVVEVLRAIAELPKRERGDALAELLVFSGLRHATQLVLEEVENMPITIDIHENEFLESIYQQALQEGKLQGEARGIEQGRKRMLMEVLEDKFGPLPGEIVLRVEAADSQKLAEWRQRFRGGLSLEKIFAE